MKDRALEALEAALRTGVTTFADIRVIESKDRSLSTKNGRAGNASSSEDLGLGIRVIANGCWGFAATSDVSKTGIEAAAKLAIEIARSGALAKAHDVQLAAESAHSGAWGDGRQDGNILPRTP